MEKEMISIITVTHMFSHGANQNKAEFRLPELKSSMRYWWRACNGFSDIKEMKERENILFGSTSQISPISLKHKKEQKYKTAQSNNCNNKDITGSSISIGQKISFELKAKKIDEKKGTRDIKFYKDLLQLSSILGGLGKYARKGQGVFYIENKEENISSSVQLIKKIRELVENIMEKNINFKLIEKKESNTFGNSRLEFSYKSKKWPQNYPYIEKIIVGNPIKMRQYINRINKTLSSRQENYMEYNFDVKGYGKNKKYKRYACPVYITCYPCFHKESNQEQEVFPIIVLLKNTTLTDDKIKDYYKDYFEHSKESGKKDDIITKEERKRVKDLYENFKNICIDCMIFGK